VRVNHDEHATVSVVPKVTKRPSPGSVRLMIANGNRMRIVQGHSGLSEADTVFFRFFFAFSASPDDRHVAAYTCMYPASNPEWTRVDRGAQRPALFFSWSSTTPEKEFCKRF
jgi:hypothetical protein